jgi:hypothetical protein
MPRAVSRHHRRYYRRVPVVIKISGKKERPLMRGRIEQAWVNRLKVMRAAIRLKHSLAADEELNAVLDAEKKKFFKNVQQGKLPAAIDTSKVLDV